MTIKEALQKLNIEDYGRRIFSSNSHGELSHLAQYVNIAEHLGENCFKFRVWFIDVVEQAEKSWQRPESVFQHIDRIFSDSIKQTYGNKQKNTDNT